MRIPGTKKDRLLWMALGLIAAAALIVQLFRGNAGTGRTVVARVDGDVVLRKPLEENGTYEILSASGFNVAEIRDRQVRIISADCENQICVHTAALGEEDTERVIACLPHKMIITVE